MRAGHVDEAIAWGGGPRVRRALVATAAAGEEPGADQRRKYAAM